MESTTTNSTSVPVLKTENGINISGKLVFENVAELVTQANDCLSNSEEQKIIIDCKQVERIDSAGIALLLNWQKQLQKQGKKCSFVNLSEQAQSLLKTYRLDALIAS